MSLVTRTTSDCEPQFGEQVTGVAYCDRPGVYALAIRENLLLVVETPAGYFLPGGGIDTGESPDDALRRELLEEVGLSIDRATEIGKARQYVIDSTTGSGYNKLERFFRVSTSAGRYQPVEVDHLPRWVSIDDALAGLREPAQVWAVRTLLPSP